MNKILQRFYYGWWLLALKAICIAVFIITLLFIDLLIDIILLSILVKILISVIFGAGALVSIFYFIFAPDSM